MRNILANVSVKSKKHFAEKLKQIWLQSDYESAKKYATAFMNEYVLKYPQAIKVLEDGLEDSLQFFNFPEIDPRKISSTNLLKRLHKGIRRKNKERWNFPKSGCIRSYVRLLIEYREDWSIGRSYITPKIITDLITKKTA